MQFLEGTVANMPGAGTLTIVRERRPYIPHCWRAAWVMVAQTNDVSFRQLRDGTGAGRDGAMHVREKYSIDA